jgi:S-formylglutathione hydrolase FrmB
VVSSIILVKLASPWCCPILLLVRVPAIHSLTIGGAGVEGEDESWDFGTGAGFYLDATQEGWKENYKMYTYVVEELPELVAKEFPIDSSRISITGHSMGKHYPR